MFSLTPIIYQPCLKVKLRLILLTGLLCGSLWIAPPVKADEADDLVKMQQFMEVMQGYFATIEAVHDIASDPEKSAILEMQKIEEIYKNRGDRAEAIEVLQEVLKQTDNTAIRNAAAFMLADALNETGKASEAVKVLRQALQRNMR